MSWCPTSLAEAARSGDQGDLTRSRSYPLMADRPIARGVRLVRDGPAQPGRDAGQARHVRRLHRAAARHRRARLRRALLPADPSDRHDQPQGPQQRLAAPEPDDPGSPYAIGSERRRPRRRASANSARSKISAALVAACAAHGMEVALDFADPVLARSSLAQAASGMVQAAARRLDPICRKPAEEIRGHRQSGFLLRRPRRALGGAARRRAVLGRAGRAHLPRRQSAHQAVRVLGMAHPRGPVGRSRRRSSCRKRSPARR